MKIEYTDAAGEARNATGPVSPSQGSGTPSGSAGFSNTTALEQRIASLEAALQKQTEVLANKLDEQVDATHGVAPGVAGAVDYRLRYNRQTGSAVANGLVESSESRRQRYANREIG